MRPNRYQITDSKFSVMSGDDGGWIVKEILWQIDRQGDSEDAFAYHGPFTTEAEAKAFADQ
jgi:hypothetical protein